MKTKEYYENYFINNKTLFHGEKGHSILLEKLIPFIRNENEFENYNTILNLFIDVGSCIGEYTNNLLKMSEGLDNFLIYSFEPNNLNFDLLSKNIHDKIVYKNIALSNMKCNGFLYNFEGHNNFEGNQIAHINNKTNEKKNILQEIQIDTLENILENDIKNNFKIRFLKIDTEGNDSNVIKGIGRFISNIDYIIFECSDCLDDSRGTNIINPFEDIIKYLDINNFTSFYISSAGLLPISGNLFSSKYENNKQWSNVIAINNSVYNEKNLKQLNINII
jgi:FkbM family methyltransferase